MRSFESWKVESYGEQEKLNGELEVKYSNNLRETILGHVLKYEIDTGSSQLTVSHKGTMPVEHLIHSLIQSLIQFLIQSLIQSGKSKETEDTNPVSVERMIQFQCDLNYCNTERRQ